MTYIFSPTRLGTFGGALTPPNFLIQRYATTNSSYLILSIDDKPVLTPPWTTKTVPGPNLVVVVSPLTPQPTLTVGNACENLPSKPSTLTTTRTSSKTMWAHSSADSALPSIRTMAPTSRIHKAGSIRQTSLGER